MICYGCKRVLPIEKLPHRIVRDGRERHVCDWCRPLEAAKWRAKRRNKFRASRFDRLVKECRK